MTNREFYTAIVNGEINEDIIAKANDELVALDAHNAKAKEKRNEKNAETDAIVFEVLTSEPQTAAEIGAQVDFHTSKVTAACKRLAAAGKVAIGEVKNEKKNTVKCYSLA